MVLDTGPMACLHELCSGHRDPRRNRILRTGSAHQLKCCRKIMGSIPMALEYVNVNKNAVLCLSIVSNK